MRHYENLVVIKPTLTEEEIQNTIATVESIITDNGGEIVVRNDMGMRKLAYPIDKNERGFYSVIYFKGEPSSINEIERRYRINEELLRFVTIKYDSKREVAAWTQQVEKVNAAPKKEEAPAAAETTEAPAEAAETPAS
ncbi:MAG TPA: 30S ribosomal protein S6 [Helicobacteraceae bacterium]|nr:30S ribosomal protein S6 [Helicobacteraceae bacterium]